MTSRKSIEIEEFMAGLRKRNPGQPEFQLFMAMNMQFN